MSRGVPLGEVSTNQVLNSKPLMPTSFNVGVSGYSAWRLSSITPISLSLPALAGAATVGMPCHVTSHWPPAGSCAGWLAPPDGTCLVSVAVGAPDSGPAQG